jgi:hypothetical protein
MYTIFGSLIRFRNRCCQFISSMYYLCVLSPSTRVSRFGGDFPSVQAASTDRDIIGYEVDYIVP